MDYEFSSVNIQTKNKNNKTRKILLVIAIVVLLFILQKVSLSENVLKSFNKNPQNNIKTKQVSAADFSYYTKPAVQTGTSRANEVITSETAAPTPTALMPATEQTAIEKVETFIFGAKETPEFPSYSLSLENKAPENLILIVIDAGGSSYFSPENTPNMLSLSQYGFFTKEMKVKVPSTTESHTIIFTGIFNSTYDWTTYPTIFQRNTSLLDSAKYSNYTVLAIMGKGDSPQLINKTDAALYDADNNFLNLKSNLKLTPNIPQDLAETFSASNNLSNYLNSAPTPYISYNNWIKDSVKAAIRTLANSNQKFVLIINFPALDEGGHENFDAYYRQTLRETDSGIKEIFDTLVETGLLNKTAFVVTADHGMEKTKYGHGAHADTYNDLTLKVPFLVISPSIKPHYSEELYYNDDITPTMLNLLSLQQNYDTTGTVIDELFSPENFIDIGILNISYNESTLITTVKNYANLTVEDELCLNASKPSEYALACSNLTLGPFEKQTVTSAFPFSESGIYKIQSYLNHSDSNPRNDNFGRTIKIGQLHDLGIEKIEIEKNSANPQKIQVKVRVLNYGDYPENGLELSVTLGNFTRKYGPYSGNEIKVSKTSTSSWTLNQTGEVQVTAQITNYANFAADSEQENNIKSTSIHIG